MKNKLAFRHVAYFYITALAIFLLQFKT